MDGITRLTTRRRDDRRTVEMHRQCPNFGIEGPLAMLVSPPKPPRFRIEETVIADDISLNAMYPQSAEAARQHPGFFDHQCRVTVSFDIEVPLEDPIPNGCLSEKGCAKAVMGR